MYSLLCLSHAGQAHRSRASTGHFLLNGTLVGIPYGTVSQDGIVVTASGVSVENLTVCNFVGGGRGRQVAFDGGFGTGKVGLGAFEGSYLTATSTFASRSQPAIRAGVRVALRMTSTGGKPRTA